MKKYLIKKSNINNDIHIIMLNMDNDVKQEHYLALEELKYNINTEKNLQTVFKHLVEYDYIRSNVLLYNFFENPDDALDLQILIVFSTYLWLNNVNIDNFGGEDTYILYNSVVALPEYEDVLDEIIDDIDYINHGMELDDLDDVINACRQKVASIIANPSQQSLQNVVSEGKQILQMLENMKFKIEQSARIFGNDQNTSQKIIQNSDLIDKIMSSLYSVCFGLQNLDITPVYDSSQINISDDAVPDSENEGFKLESNKEEEDTENEENENSEDNTSDEETSEDEEETNDENVDEETDNVDEEDLNTEESEE